MPVLTPVGSIAYKTSQSSTDQNAVVYPVLVQEKSFHSPTDRLKHKI